MRLFMVPLVVAIVAAIILTLVDWSVAHGMMLSPPGRSSRWRYNKTAPVNYDDNANYCGGFSIQFNQNDGKCGLCGDNYADPKPRANELGGKYGGSGVIVQRFKHSYTAVINFRITANHLGYVFYQLCDLDEFPHESEECFGKYNLKFADGSDKYYIGSTRGGIDTTVVLPLGLSCKHCVLRWTYIAGNNWGICPDGRGALGCGNQETFKSCADISIVGPNIRRSMVEVQDKGGDHK